MKGKSFKIDTNAISRLSDKISKAGANYDRVIENRVKQATAIVWRTAHAKRPMISKEQMKAEGRSHRVSDPSAQAGVPVRTGALQNSIKQSVSRTAFASFRGIVETMGIKYAGFIEYGTSKMKARPFMRPAAFLNRDAIKHLFGLQVEQR